MVHAYGREFEAAAGDPLTQRTFATFFDALRTFLSNGVTVVAEAQYQDRLWRIGLEPLTSLAHLRVVHCKVDPAVGRQRRDAAHETGGANAHARIIGDDVEDWARAYASFDRLSVAAPSIEVDTTDGYAPGLAEIAAFVRRA
jgi:predicted kinase